MKNGKKWLLRQVVQQQARIQTELININVDPYAYKMWAKGVSAPIYVYDVPTSLANLIKQEGLASGIDVAVSKNSISCKDDLTDILILGNIRGVKILAERLKRQPFGRLVSLSEQLQTQISNPLTPVLKVKNSDISLDTPLIMGIVNITPDSFSDGGKYLDSNARDAHIEKLFSDGAKIVDIGAVSTKPKDVYANKNTVTEQQELERLLPAVESAIKIAKKYNGYVSVDTFRSKVADLVLKAGADIINDQSAFSDPLMGGVCASHGAAVVLMHCLGDPQNFEKNANYENIVTDIFKYLHDAVEKALQIGINSNSIIIDPGFGFSKTANDNYYILKQLKEFTSLGYTVLVGISRKYMTGVATGKDINSREFGTVACEMVAMMNGAKIIRTHNVGAAVDALNIYTALDKSVNSHTDGNK